MRYQREVVQDDIEKKILTGLIVSDEFCNHAFRMLKPVHFQVKHIRRISTWLSAYYSRYKRAPGKTIQSLFATERKSLDEDEAELIERLLQDVSDAYALEEEGGGDGLNVPYLADQTTQFCKTRNLQLLNDEIEGQLQKGKVDKAEEAVRNFGQVASTTSRWINPLSRKAIRQAMIDNDGDRLFKLPGVLGDLTGYLERGWLVAYMGPMKRGKSWYLQDLSLEALHNKRKVCYVSLEMSAKNMQRRIYSRLTAAAKEEREFKYPVFDCYHNQDGSCDKSARVNSVTLRDSSDEQPPINLESIQEWKEKGYKPCTVCRTHRSPDYKPDHWFEIHNAKKIDSRLIEKKAEIFKSLYGSNLRVIAFPPFSTSFTEIINAVEELAFTEDFIPDVLCVDYFDIMAPEKAALSERGDIDIRWKRGKGVSVEKHCLVATVSQTNRFSIEKVELDEEDAAEDIRKFAHVDIMWGLNQTREEKMHGLMRIGVMAHRHEEFNIRGYATCLQSLSLGQPILDCEYDINTYERLYSLKRPVRKNKKSKDNK